jgi:hypothetical protein
MALRKPLVQVSGQPQQLQAGDTLDAPQSGVDVLVQTNDEATPIVIGAPVYNDAADGVKKAQANAAGTKKVLGLVAQAPSIAAAATGPIATSGVLSATTAQWDAVAATVGGLVFGTVYWLDPTTAGKITSTAPSAVGQYINRIGVAVSTTELKLNIDEVGILL